MNLERTPHQRTLLTVSTAIPEGLEEDCNAGLRPVPDYLALSRGLPADLCDDRAAQRDSGILARLFSRVLGKPLLIALVAYRRRADYQTIITDNERVGFYLAALLQLGSRKGTRPRHAMIAHVLSTKKKRLPLWLFRLHLTIDVFIVYSTSQSEFIEEWATTRNSTVVLVPFTVDHRFFRPSSQQGDGVVSVGMEQRDYLTLFESVRGVDTEVVVAADSPYARSGRAKLPTDVPSNVSVTSVGPTELRELYQRASIAVTPLVENPFQAGVTAMLEAMAMELPLIVSATKGQTDVINDGVTGLTVPPEDVGALRHVLLEMLSSPDQRRSLGAKARQQVIERHSHEKYVDVIRAAADSH